MFMNCDTIQLKWTVCFLANSSHHLYEVFVCDGFGFCQEKNRNTSINIHTHAYKVPARETHREIEKICS